jgi:hypothetical protein
LEDTPSGRGGNLDPRTMEQLRRLETLKKEAVANEDYQMAKNLKDRIQRLKNLGEQIALLESRKEKAIQKEDYDSAMVLKEEIQRLRGQFEIGGNVEGFGQQMKMGRGEMEYEMGRREKEYEMGRREKEYEMGRREKERTTPYSGMGNEGGHFQQPIMEKEMEIGHVSREVNQPQLDPMG